MSAKAQQQRYRVLIERLASQAKTAPQAYRTRVALLAALGFGVLALLVLVAVGLPLGIVAALLITGRGFDPWALYLLIPQALFATMVVRALWLRFEPPAGYRLSPEDAPELAADIERLRLEAGAPALDEVVIDSELNAGAASMPRLLGLAGYRHTLVIGLPLMRVLDRDELASVIAHEFGHFRGGHGRFSGWVYRVRLSWFRLVEALASAGGILSLPLLMFFRWYAPYFSAYSFVLAREDEYEADAVSARLVGDAAQVSALIRVEHAAQYLKRRFWPQMQARMRAQSQPSPGYSALLAAALREAPPVDAARMLASTTRENASDNDLEDTHPTLSQRVSAVGAPSALRERGVPAVAMLGEALSRIERRLDDAWREQVRAPWAAVYASANDERVRLDAMERRSDWSPAERLEHARLVDQLRPDFDAASLYERALEAMPDNENANASAYFRVGVLRIDSDNPIGAAHLRRAMQLDAGAVRPVFETLNAYARDGTLTHEVTQALGALREEFAVQALSLTARDGVAEDDDLAAHDLDAAALEALRAALARIEPIGAAWLARKRLDIMGEPAHYTLLVTWRGSVASETAGLKRVVAALQLPGSVSVFTESEHKAEARRVRALCVEPVYRRRN
jgi:Zn-dependent protease with chaperone function